MADISQLNEPTRLANKSDRLRKATGYCDELLYEIYAIATDRDNPGHIFGIGKSEHFENITYEIRQRIDPAFDGKIFIAKPEIERRGQTIPFSLKSDDCTDWLIKHVNQKDQLKDPEDNLGRIKLVILAFQFGREQGLDKLLKSTDVPIIRITEDLKDGRVEVDTSWDGALPASVDVTAVRDDEEDESLPPIPADSLFGRCWELAEMTQGPMGFAYLAVLAAVSVFVKSVHNNIRPNIYGGLVGDKGCGKSVTADRALQLFGLQDESGTPLAIPGITLVRRTPASDRGLYQMYQLKELVRSLLHTDEGRNMMGKASIQGSTLISLLCELFNSDHAGLADKYGDHSLNLRLSILANFKAKDESEFPEIFTHATAHGLWDRFLFGVLREKWYFKPWELNGEVQKLSPTTPNVPRGIFDRTHEWARAADGRQRLAELALRVAYITSAISEEEEVNDAALDAALCFMEWQVKIRRVFQPAEGSNEHENCVKTVLTTFRNAPGRAANWRQLSRKHHWYEKFPRALTGVKNTLEREGALVYDKTSKKHCLCEATKEKQ